MKSKYNTSRREACHNESTFAPSSHSLRDEGHNAEESNALDPDDAGWFKVSPYGVFPGKIPGRSQHFSQAEAKAMESQFNSVAGKMGRMFRGAAIFIGHPDVDRAMWPDERRLGKVTELQARADGLWAKPEWNSLGRENLENGFWIYPSPRWDGPGASREFKPDRLLSIGLTNMPRIVTSEPVANAMKTQDGETQDAGISGVVAGSGEGKAADAVDMGSPKTDTIMDRKLMIEKLDLPPEATDDEIWAKMDAVLKENADMAAAEKAKLDGEAKKTADVADGAAPAADAEKKKAVDELAAARKEIANSRVELAIAEGRIAAAEADVWRGRLNGENREAEYNSLKALRPKLNTSALDLKKTREQVGGEMERRETIANAVRKVQDTGKGYAESYNVVKNDPQYKAIFEAMHEPGREE